MLLRTLARAYHNNKQAISCDNGRCELPLGTIVYFLNPEGNLVDQPRVLTHPGLPLIAGQGIYEYPFNPDITKNFIYGPAAKMDTAVQRTIGSNIAIQKPQKYEDVVITEIWLGNDRILSTLSEMARVFDTFWKTQLPADEFLGWEPLDRTTDRFLVRIVSVQIGGIDYEYEEVREHVNQNQGSYLKTQLTLILKLERGYKPPKATITLEGL